MVKVMDPTAQQGFDDPSPGPDVGSLVGTKVGFRVDILWPAYDWVADEWMRALADQGAEISSWRGRGRVNEEGDAVLAELDEFVAGIDACITGLANCGSCTSWTVHDALVADRAGIPSVAIATSHFAHLTRALARRSGRSGLRIHELPYPLHTLPEEEVRDIARANVGPLLRTLGVRT